MGSGSGFGYPGCQGSRLPGVQVSGPGSQCQVSDPGSQCQISGSGSQYQISGPSVRSRDSGPISPCIGPGNRLIGPNIGYSQPWVKERVFSPGSDAGCQTKSSPGRGQLAFESRTRAKTGQLFPEFDRSGLTSLKTESSHDW